MGMVLQHIIIIIIIIIQQLYVDHWLTDCLFVGLCIDFE